MKKMFQITFNQNAGNIWLLILRVCIATFMLTHGYHKLTMLLAGGEIEFMDPLGIGMTTSLYLSVFAEFFCSLFLLFGLATRFAAIALIINMSVASFLAHAGQPFHIRELALLYLLFYITLLVFGGGKYSVDYFINIRK